MIGEFIIREKKCIFVAIPSGNWRRNGRTYERIGSRTVSDCERILGRPLYNSELIIFKQYQNNPNIRFVKSPTGGLKTETI